MEKWLDIKLIFYTGHFTPQNYGAKFFPLFAKIARGRGKSVCERGGERKERDKNKGLGKEGKVKEREEERERERHERGEK